MRKTIATTIIVSCLLLTSSVALADWSDTPTYTGVCGGGAGGGLSTQSVGVYFGANYCIESTDQYGYVYSNILGSWESVSNSEFLNTYTDLYGNVWGVTYAGVT
jgi:hypothetical protein